MEEINTWQKREKETGVPSHWPESGEDAGLAFRVLGGVASAGDAAANESKKKEKIGSGPGLGDTGREGTWTRNQRALG